MGGKFGLVKWKTEGGKGWNRWNTGGRTYTFSVEVGGRNQNMGGKGGKLPVEGVE